MFHSRMSRRMETFLEANAGLKRRIQHTFTFQDFSTQELAQIFLRKAKQEAWRLNEVTEEDWTSCAVFFSSSGKRSRRGNVESTLKSYATCKLIGWFGFVWKIGDRNSNVMKPHCFPVWWQFLGIEAYPVPVLGGVSQLVSGQQPYYNPVRYRITQVLQL